MPPTPEEIKEWERDEAEYPRQHTIVGTLTCPACHVEVELEAETDEWQRNEETGRWEHAGYGPANAWCGICGRIYVEDMDGRLLVLTRPEEGAHEDA